MKTFSLCQRIVSIKRTILCRRYHITMKFLFAFSLLTFILGAQGQSCGIEGINESETVLPPMAEGTDGGTIFARYQLWNVASTSTVSHPHNKYLSAQRYMNGVYELLTTTSFPDFVAVERSEEIRRTATLLCNDNSNVRVTFVIPVPDQNDRPPVFSEQNYQVHVQLPLVGHTVVPTTIDIHDADLLEENAKVLISSSNRDFVPFVSYDGSGSSWHYHVDLMVRPDLEEGIYNTFITAEDGRFVSSAYLSIVVLAPGTPEPEPTEGPSTTTQVPETPETTTEEEPSTDETEETTEDPTEETYETEPEITTEEVTEETGEPEPEITTEKEEPETTETFEPEPTMPPTQSPPTTPEEETGETDDNTPAPTTQPPPQACGFVGLNAGDMINLDAPLDAFLPPNTEVWRNNMWNVNYTTAAWHSHNKYILAFRTGSEYWMRTSDSYNNFIPETGGNVIFRIVNLYCNGGGVVNYRFALDIYDGPITEPTMKPKMKARKPFY